MSNVYEEEIQDIKKVFKANCFGVVLSARTHDDFHVCFTIIVEDDGNWFIDNKGKTDSYWLIEVIEVLTEARKWILNHCIEPDSSPEYLFPHHLR